MWENLAPCAFSTLCTAYAVENEQTDAGKGDRAELRDNRLPEAAVPEAGAGGECGENYRKDIQCALCDKQRHRTIRAPHRILAGGIILTIEGLQQLKKANGATVKRADIADVQIDMDAPLFTRFETFLAQIRNPYYFCCGNIAVNIEYSNEGKTLKDAVSSYLSTKKDSLT